MYVARRMKKNVLTVAPSASLQEARQTMKERNIHQLVVTAPDGTLIGIVSDRDIRGAAMLDRIVPDVSHADAEKLMGETPVETIMKRKVVTATPADTLEDAIVLMHDYGVNALPVLDSRGRVVGIVTRTDVLKAFIDTLGVGEPSARIEVLVDDRPGQLARLLDIVLSFNVNVTSMITSGHVEEGKMAVFFRVATLNTLPMKKAMADAGFTLIDPTRFTI